jgi:hypothetical protein
VHSDSESLSINPKSGGRTFSGLKKSSVIKYTIQNLKKNCKYVAVVSFENGRYTLKKQIAAFLWSSKTYYTYAPKTWIYQKV